MGDGGPRAAASLRPHDDRLCHAARVRAVFLTISTTHTAILVGPSGYV